MAEGNAQGPYKHIQESIKFHGKHPPRPENVFTGVILI